jgi:hypothetical protein
MTIHIVNIKENVPIVLFDDLCYLCTKFANIVNFLSKDKLTIIGHYSIQGEKIRDQILDDSALEMFWLIDEKIAYGGRAAIVPLIRAILMSKKKNSNNVKFESRCNQECKTIKSVFIRSASLLSNSKKIELK